MSNDTNILARQEWKQALHASRDEVHAFPAGKPFFRFSSSLTKTFGSKDVKKVLASKKFYPVYITGLSGNGKTLMVEQVCHELGRECVRVNVTSETDEDDLIGGYRLVDGNTVQELP